MQWSNPLLIGQFSISILTSEFVKQQINSKDYSLLGISVSTYLISHLVSFANNEKYINKIGEEQKEKVLYFFNNCNIATVNIINDILNETINVTISETKDSWVTIYTPNGSLVNAYQRDSEPLGWWARWRAKRYVKREYPNATVKRDATGKYNCHSYAWYSRATSNNKWINAYNSYYNNNCYDENLHEYWNDGSYYQVSSSGYGKIASYGTCGDNDHSAKWITSNKVVSKWGQGCLVEHNYDYCPYNSSNITNYKRYIEPTFSCSITGPSKATNSGTYTWYSHVSNGTASSYLWKYSYDGNNYFGTFGTTQNVTTQMPLDNDLFLKLIVTSTNNEQAIAYHTTINMSNWHKVYPNPVKDILTIEINKSKMPKRLISQKIEIRLYNKMMSLMKKTFFIGTSINLNVSDLKPDIYILQIIVGDKIFEEKIVVSDR